MNSDVNVTAELDVSTWTHASQYARRYVVLRVMHAYSARGMNGSSFRCYAMLCNAMQCDMKCMFVLLDVLSGVP